MTTIERPAAAAQEGRYGAAAQAFHWLTAVLVLAAFIMGPGGSEERVYSSARDFDRQVHESLGLTVFVLTALRMGWRLIDPPPALPPMHAVLRLLARAFHAALYGLLLAVPLTAIAGAWLEGHPLTLLASVTIPPPVAPSHDVGAQLASLHKLLGDVLIWLAGLHALAALVHHFVLRDRVLRAMLPSRGNPAR